MTYVVVWSGSSHRDIQPDAEILANRARAMEPHRSPVLKPHAVDQRPVESRRAILRAIWREAKPVAQIAREARRSDRTVKFWLDRMVTDGIVDRSFAPLPSGQGGNGMSLYRRRQGAERPSFHASGARGSGPSPGMGALSEQEWTR